MIKNKRQAFAHHCMMDLSEVNEYRYRTGRTSQPVWSVGDTDYCVTKGVEKPAKDRDNDYGWAWVAKGEIEGFKIWESKK